MSNYTERVSRNLEGLEAVSTGVCPGCSECFSEHDYTAAEADDGRWYIEALGEGPNAPLFDSEESAEAAIPKHFEAAWSSGGVESEASFSWRGCGVCGSSLGGNLERWHALDAKTGALYHFSDACTDCVVYITNGDEPNDS